MTESGFGRNIDPSDKPAFLLGIRERFPAVTTMGEYESDEGEMQNTLRCAMKRFWLVVVFVCCVAVQTGHSASHLNRDHDPVMVSNADLMPYWGDSVSDVRVLVYDAMLQEWSPIPFQIDQRNAEGYYFDHNGIIDPLDELVFMSRDLGDRVPVDSFWPDVEHVRDRARIEIRVSDPLTGKEGYAYLFHTFRLPKSNRQYVSYLGANTDVVYGESYHVAHDPSQASGLPTALLIPESAGGDSLDFLDRQRLRFDLNIKASVSGINVELDETLKENMNKDIKVSGITVANITVERAQMPIAEPVDGPVRIVRKNYIRARINAQSVDEQTFDIPLPPYFYYPSFYTVPLQLNLNLTDQLQSDDFDIKIKRATFSQVLDGNGRGMIYYNTPNAAVGVRINDTYHAGFGGYDLGRSEWPGLHWYAEVADPAQSTIQLGTLFSLLELQGDPFGDSQAIVFREYDEDDGRRLYGDAGLRIAGQAPDYITGDFALDMVFRNYVLPRNMTYAELDAFFQTYSTSLDITTREDDQSPPGGIQQLAIDQSMDESVVLSFVDSGDDKYVGGAVDQVIVKYSTEPISGQPETWWSGAITATVIEDPGEPGTPHSLTIAGLDPGQMYTFGVRALDNGGNLSSLSVISASTTPVELAAFEATSEGNTVVLSWTTHSETNNLGFAIERRFEGQTPWDEIAFVQGHGTTSSDQDYHYKDRLMRTGTIEYRLRQIDTQGTETVSASVQVVLSSPQQFVLDQNYPNPFNPQTTLRFEIPETIQHRVSLMIYDMTGRRVRTLVDGQVAPGYHETLWRGDDDQGQQVSSGVYVAVLSAGSFKSARKLIKIE